MVIYFIGYDKSIHIIVHGRCIIVPLYRVINTSCVGNNNLKKMIALLKHRWIKLCRIIIEKILTYFIRSNLSYIYIGL